MVYRLTRAAEDQIDAVLLESARTYGLEAADRYGHLILIAMAAQPDLPGYVGVPRLEGIRAYPTRLARRRVAAASRVGAPRHLIIYRRASDGVVEILGLVHDRMVLSRAARRMVQRAGLPDDQGPTDRG